MRRVITALFTVLLLSACGTIEKEQKSQSLHNSTRFYEYALRWGDYEKANGMRSPEGLMASPAPESLEKFRITSYTLIDSYLSDDGLVLNQIVELRYYNEENLYERSITDRQKWVYDEEAEVWYLESPMPAFQ